ncbi:MAG: hypothetical protein JJ964_14110, partial [Rhizobiales bacterium]|nr:hypothetical protein [Hyphomicrobiales bacterium]
MPKFRKKPVVIEAFKWTGDTSQEDDPVWMSEAIERGDVWFVGAEEVVSGSAIIDSAMMIKTLEGDHRATLGDYIIQGVKGEIYPCKPDIFEATYEPA